MCHPPQSKRRGGDEMKCGVRFVVACPFGFVCVGGVGVGDDAA